MRPVLDTLPSILDQSGPVTLETVLFGLLGIVVVAAAGFVVATFFFSYRLVKQRWRFITLPIAAYITLFALGLGWGAARAFSENSLVRDINVGTVSICSTDSKAGKEYEIIWNAARTVPLCYEMRQGQLSQLPALVQSSLRPVIKGTSPLTRGDLPNLGGGDPLQGLSRARHGEGIGGFLRLTEPGDAAEKFAFAIAGFPTGDQLGRQLRSSLFRGALDRAVQSDKVVARLRRVAWQRRLLAACMADSWTEGSVARTEEFVDAFRYVEECYLSKPTDRFYLRESVEDDIKVLRAYHQEDYAGAIEAIGRAIEKQSEPDSLLEDDDLVAIDRFERLVNTDGSLRRLFDKWNREDPEFLHKANFALGNYNSKYPRWFEVPERVIPERLEKWLRIDVDSVAGYMPAVVSALPSLRGAWGETHQDTRREE